MSVDQRILRNANSGEILLGRAQMCTSYWCHLRGLQFRRHLPDDAGLIFVTETESIVGTSIHMLNVFMAISVVWLNAERVVVDKKLAKPWRPFYASSAPAMYYVEANVGLLDRVQVGDVLTFDEAAS